MCSTLGIPSLYRIIVYQSALAESKKVTGRNKTGYVCLLTRQLEFTIVVQGLLNYILLTIYNTFFATRLSPIASINFEMFPYTIKYSNTLNYFFLNDKQTDLNISGNRVFKLFEILFSSLV